MESSITSNLPKNRQALADKAAELSSSAGSALTKAVGRVQSIGRQGVDAVSDAAQQAREVASDTSDSIIRYTKKNPIKALMIAAASGALLLTLAKVLKPSRD